MGLMTMGLQACLQSRSLVKFNTPQHLHDKIKTVKKGEKKIIKCKKKKKKLKKLKKKCLNYAHNVLATGERRANFFFSK